MLIKKEQNHQYIIIEELQNMDAFALQMITENKIPGLIVCRQQIFNGERNLYYDITGKQPLSDSTVKLSGADLRCLLESLLLTLESLSSYFLPPDGISFDLDTVFLENDTWSFCYVPQKEGRLRENSVAFSQELLGKVNQDDEQAVVLVYQFYQMIKRRNDTLHYVLSQILYGDEYRDENMDTYEICYKEDGSRIHQYKREEDDGRIYQNKRKEDDGRIYQNKRKEDDGRIYQNKRKGDDGRIYRNKRKGDDRRILHNTRKEDRGEMRTASVRETGQRNTVAEEAVLSETEPDALAREGRCGKIDKTTLFLFVMVCLCSLGYGVYTVLTWQVFSLQAFCRLRQGILSIAFFILAVCGILGTCLLPRCSIFAGKNQTTEPDAGRKKGQDLTLGTGQETEQRIEQVASQNKEQETAYEVPPINI